MTRLKLKFFLEKMSLRLSEWLGISSLSHLNHLGDIRPWYIFHWIGQNFASYSWNTTNTLLILFFNSKIGSISHYLELLWLHGSHRAGEHIFPSWSQDWVSLNIVYCITRYIRLLARYTLLSEICDEQGRRLAYINGWVFWVVGMATIPFIGLQMLFSKLFWYLHQVPCTSNLNLKTNLKSQNHFS